MAKFPGPWSVLIKVIFCDAADVSIDGLPASVTGPVNVTGCPAVIDPAKSTGPLPLWVNAPERFTVLAMVSVPALLTTRDPLLSVFTVLLKIKLFPVN